VTEIENNWTFEMIRKGLAYIDMKTAIDRAIQAILMPKAGK